MHIASLVSLFNHIDKEDMFALYLFIEGKSYDGKHRLITLAFPAFVVVSDLFYLVCMDIYVDVMGLCKTPLNCFLYIFFSLSWQLKRIYSISPGVVLLLICMAGTLLIS